MSRVNSTILILFALLNIPVAYSQPKIFVRGGEKYDLGNIFEGTSTERKLTLLNAGNDTLYVQNVTTSCGCTVAKLSQHTVPPNDSIIVSVTFNSKENLGKFKRDVYIFSNDSTRKPNVDIIFTGSTYTVLQAVPSYVSFGRQRLNHSDERTVVLKNTGRTPITLVSYKSPESQFSLSINKKMIAPQDSLQLKILLNPTKAGRLLGQIEVKTDSEIKPVIKISYVGEVRGKSKLKMKN
jgi:hypothetical protein